MALSGAHEIAHFPQVVTSTWRWHHETLSIPNQTCSMCFNMFLMCEVSVDFLTGLSRLSIHHNVLVMCIIDLENNGRANCPRTSGNPDFRQNSAKFCRFRRNSTVRKPAKQHRMSFSWQISAVSRMIASPLTRMVYTRLLPTSSCWTRPLLGTSKVFVSTKYEFIFIR